MVIEIIPARTDFVAINADLLSNYCTYVTCEYFFLHLLRDRFQFKLPGAFYHVNKNIVKMYC
jgi:hypothetical protein